MNADGSFLYTPTAGYTGKDTFTYDDSDGVNTSNVATATIYVGTQSNITFANPFTAPTAAEGSPTSSTSPFITWNFASGSESDYTVIVQWGDGTESAGTLGTLHEGMPTVKGSHTYTMAGSYTMTVVIIGDANVQNTMAVFTDCQTATISERALTATALTFPALANQSTTVETATFTDTDPNANPANYTATINWGNGAEQPPRDRSRAGLHLEL
jgi:hypothetical protein